MFVESQLPFEIKCHEMHFCGKNVVVVCCIFLEQHFVLIIMVIISGQVELFSWNSIQT